jgi:cation diffusion facilitator CzcD-associated flavoprotein CzcO
MTPPPSSGTLHKHLILGAGPTGLAVARALKEAGIPYVQVEAEDRVGGNWAHGVYETAHIISSRRTTEFPDYPMPAHWPDFPSAEQMRAYMQDYAEHFDLLRGLRFKTRVTAVRQRGDERWDVTFDDGSTQVYKGVLVCNGHHWDRSFPAWAKDFTGELFHSKDYKRPGQLAGKRVLTVGAGNSGCDVACEAARVGAASRWSMRRGYWFMPKTLCGRPSVELVKPWLPVPAQRVVVKSLLRVVVGRYEDYGLPTPDHDIFEAHPTISSEVFHYIRHGRLTIRPDVKSVCGQIVTFVDGSSEEFDTVVCATGFDVSFPFLPPGMIPVKGKTPELIAGLVRPDLRGLYIVGAYQPRYGIGPLLRPLGLLLAALLPLQDDLNVPLGRLLQAVGQRPLKSHLVDPHAAMRDMQLGRALVPALRLVARARGWYSPGIGSAPPVG